MSIDMQERFKDFMGAVGQVIGLDSLVPSEAGLVSLGVDSHEFRIQLIPASGKILVFLAVGRLRKGAAAGVYKALLSANLFAHETGGGWFGLEGGSEDVIYHHLVDFSPLPPDPEDFVLLLEKSVELAEYWERHLQELDNAGEPVSDVMPPMAADWSIQP